MKSFKKALKYLETSLISGFWKPGERLPSLIELGKAAGVSEFTMGKAIHVLVEKGVLSIRPRKGIWVSLNTNEPENGVVDSKEKVSEGSKKDLDSDSYRYHSVQAQKWERIKAAIVRDIYSGVFDVSKPLPTISELRPRYGSGYNVIKKSLDSLEKDGLLLPYKKTYKPILLSAVEHKSRILVLVQNFPDERKQQKNLKIKGLYISTRVKKFIAEIETICNKRNLFFDLVFYSIHENRLRFVDPINGKSKKIDNSNTYYGILLMKSDQHSSAFERLLYECCGFCKPMSIIDEYGVCDWALPKTNNREICLFPFAQSGNAGYKIGRFLLELGHRNVAFISPFHKEQWSINRYLGLSKAFGMADCNAQVHLYVDNDKSAYDINELISNKNIRNFLETLPLLYVEQMKKSNLFSEEHIFTFQKMITQPMLSARAQLEYRIILEPTFEKVLGDKSITAWVLADDHIALCALEFLKNKKVAVPQDISVIGFDEVPESLYEGLTTYNYDIAGVVMAALAFISNPDVSPNKGSPVVECCGHIVPRQSTGQVRPLEILS